LCGTCGCAVNGKIYVIGGAYNVYGDGLVDSVYEYTPATDTWARKSSIPTPMYLASAETINGKIYVIGGAPAGFNWSYNSVYEYDPVTDMWATKSNMPTARSFASATAVDGKIYVFGGVANLNGLGFSTVEVYDPSLDKWSVKNEMPVPRAGHASSAVDGNIYIFSGAPGRGISLYNDVLEYNPTLDSWATKTNIPTPRVALSACTVGENIYTIGGMDVHNIRLSTVEEYEPALDLTNVKDQENKTGILKEYILYQNFPNPFNPTTTITWDSPVNGTQVLKVYNLLGSEEVVLSNGYKPAGSYEVEFDATNLPSGIYFLRLTAGSFEQTKKMILLK
jgi:N-acetylneuraminic acid mutarotase